MKIKILTFFFVIVSVFLTVAYAEKSTTYSVSYANTNKINVPSLKNVVLNAKLYKHGNLVKTFTIQTNNEQKFTLKHTLTSGFVVEILLVRPGKKQKIRCHGTSTLGKTKVILNCHRIKN